MRKHVILLLCLVFLGVADVGFGAIEVLQLGHISHTAAQANIHPTTNPINVTVVTSLGTLDLGNYDVLYLNEHSSGAYNGREGEVRNALLAGELGLIHTTGGDYTALRTVLDAPTLGAVSTSSVTTPIVTHALFTGAGIPGGAVVDTSTSGISQGTRNTYSNLPTGSTVLATSNGNPQVVTGTVGLGRYFLLGAEPMESAPSANSAERQYVYNAINLAAQSANAVPEPTTFAIWSTLGALGLIGARRRRKAA